MFCENFEIAAVQKDANLVELEKCCRTHIFLQKFVLIQPRTSPPKNCKILQKFQNCGPVPVAAHEAEERAGAAEVAEVPKRRGGVAPDVVVVVLERLQEVVVDFADLKFANF